MKNKLYFVNQEAFQLFRNLSVDVLFMKIPQIEEFFNQNHTLEMYVLSTMY